MVGLLRLHLSRLSRSTGGGSLRPCQGSRVRAARSPDRRPASAIRCSAMRSAATAGGTPSASASANTSRVVSKIRLARCRARSKSKPVQLVGDLDQAAGVDARSPARRGSRARPAASPRRGGRAGCWRHRRRRAPAGRRPRRRSARRRGRTVRRRPAARRRASSVSATRAHLGVGARRPGVSGWRRDVGDDDVGAVLEQVLGRGGDRPCRPRRPRRCGPRSVGAPQRRLGGRAHALEHAVRREHRASRRRRPGPPCARSRSGTPRAITSMSSE